MNWEWDWGRLAVALGVGALLSHAGSLVQLTTRNELASPSTLGMDGLAVAVVLAVHALHTFLGLSLPLEMVSLAALPPAALLAWAWPVRWLPYEGKRGQDFQVVLLLGLGLNLLVGAVFSLLHFLAMAFNQEFPDQLWFGRIGSLSPPQALAGLAVVMAVFGLGAWRRRQWRALLLGTGWCQGLGVPVASLTKQALGTAFVANLWVVTQFGAFSFLGLLFPLLLRQSPRYLGNPWRELSEGALLCGGTFALLDHACYNLTFQGAEVPVGLPAGLGGACALVLLLWQRAKRA